MDSNEEMSQNVSDKPVILEISTPGVSTESQSCGKSVETAIRVDATKKKIKRGRTSFTRRKGSRLPKNVQLYQGKDTGPLEPLEFDIELGPVSAELEPSHVALQIRENPEEVPLCLISPSSETDEKNVEERHVEVEKLPPSDIPEETHQQCILVKPDVPLIKEVLEHLKSSVPSELWLCRAVDDGIDVLLLSRHRETAVQRRAFFSYSKGIEEITVHRKRITESVQKSVLDGINFSCVSDPLTIETKDSFIQHIISVVQRLQSFEICMGIYEEELKVFWELDKSCVVDNNPYNELRYKETFRTLHCELLVPTVKTLKKRCDKCMQVKTRLVQRLKRRGNELSQFTPNIYLRRDELLDKLDHRKRELDTVRAQVARLAAPLQKTIESEAVYLDEKSSDELCNVLNTAKNKSLIHDLFIQEQVKAASAKGPSGRRWHPSILRFALLLKTTSSAAYHALVDSKAILLPSERTLYDYSHVTKAGGGCTKNKLNRVCKELLDQSVNPDQEYFVLYMDEVHINKKLVYKTSTGEMIGYVDLSDVDTELANLEAELKGNSVPGTPRIATKVLAFMVRGVSRSLKAIVATFPTTDELDSDALFDKVWEVIGALETSGVKVIGLVSDGASANRAFYEKHLRYQGTEDSEVLYVTYNLCDFSRPFFFFSDPVHLLKTLRNCFHKSGFGNGYTRLLTKNNEFIVWDTIRKLYETDKGKNLRRCYKLNANDVFLNSFSIMKAGPAFHVLSNSVATDLETRGWPKIEETIKFIRQTNNFIDMINGSTLYDGQKSANPNKAPYTDVNDERFEKLLGFVDYLKEWKREVDAKPGFSSKEKKKMIISKQTLDGVEITVRSFLGATKFLLGAGVKYVLGRIFCQDPLEKYFGKQRQSGGGSRNPTVAKLYDNDEKIHIHRDLNVRNSNVGGKRKGMQVDDTPLPKRKQAAKKNQPTPGREQSPQLP